MVQGISFDGMASGLNTEQIIAKLMHLERAPVRRLESRRETHQKQREVWGEVNTALSSFGSSLGDLRQDSTFVGRSVDVGNDSVLDASLTDDAEAGTYEVVVEDLATAHRMASGRFANADEPLELAGSFQIVAGSDEHTIEILEDDSLVDVRDAINEKDAGIRASMIDNRLVLTSDSTGAANSIALVDGAGDVLESLGLIDTAEAAFPDTSGGALDAVSVGDRLFVERIEANIDGTAYESALVDGSGKAVAVSAGGTSHFALAEPTGLDELSGAEVVDGSLDFSSPVTSGVVDVLDDGTGGRMARGASVVLEMEEPKDARFSVDGIPIRSSSNGGIEGVIPDVTLDLRDVGSSTLTVGLDTDAAVSAVERFVHEYNGLNTYLNSLGEEEGILQGDTTLLRLQSLVRRSATDEVAFEDGVSLRMLSQVGITVDKEGEMSLDSEELAAALSEDPEAVRDLFAAEDSVEGADGVARRLQGHLETYLRYGDGVLERRDQMHERMIQNLDGQIDSTEARMERREESLRRQFTQLERMLSEFQTQGQWLQGQISSLSGRDGG
ncbi:MAG: flagellar filament capping protein FliD [Clostridia bacterium]